MKRFFVTIFLTVILLLAGCGDFRLKKSKVEQTTSVLKDSITFVSDRKMVPKVYILTEGQVEPLSNFNYDYVEVQPSFSFTKDKLVYISTSSDSILLTQDPSLNYRNFKDNSNVEVKISKKLLNPKWVDEEHIITKTSHNGKVGFGLLNIKDKSYKFIPIKNDYILEFDSKDKNIFYVTMSKEDVSKQASIFEPSLDPEKISKLYKLDLRSLEEEKLVEIRGAIYNISVDKNRILYSLNSGKIGEIYLINLDNLKIRRLTNNNYYDGEPCFVSENRMIYVSNADGDRDIYSMNIDGSEKRQLTNNGWEDYNIDY